MVAVAVAILPRATTRTTSVLITVLAALHIPLAWAAAFQREVVLGWMHVLVTAVAS
jgi:predicted small integral membrane protein